MEIQEINKRNIVFTFKTEIPGFNGVTNVFCINTEDKFIICDTFLGNKPMEEIISFLENKYQKKKYLIFNSHSDYDHFWGNSAFQNSKIISHTKCSENIRKDEQLAFLRENKKYYLGNLQIIAPNFVFEQELFMREEGIVFFYTPLHTMDSASCFDAKENILYVADNMEYPIPYLNHSDFELMTSVLEKYKALSPEIIVTGHGKLLDVTAIDDHLKYIEALSKKNYKKYEKGIYRPIHLKNMGNIKL